MVAPRKKEMITKYNFCTMCFRNKISTCTSAEQSTMESQFNIVLSTLNRTSAQCSEKKTAAETKNTLTIPSP